MSRHRSPRPTRRWLILLILMLLLMSSLTSCITAPASKVYLPPMPTVGELTKDQKARTPVDVKETIRDREIAWQALWEAVKKQVQP